MFNSKGGYNKFISIVLIIFSMLIAIFFFIPKTHNNSVALASNFESYDASMALYSNIYQDFLADNHNDRANDETYKDNYSGVYIDSVGELNLCLQENNVENLNNNINPANYGNDIKIQYKKYSFNYLSNIYNLLSVQMDEYSIDSIALSQKQNCVVIEVSDLSRKMNLITELYQNGIPHDAINIVLGEKTQLTANSAKAGQLIYYKHGFLNLQKYGGTITIQARDKATGAYGVVTAGHVALSDENMYNADNKKIGKPTKRQFSGPLDASFIPFPDSNWTIYGDIYNSANSTSSYAGVATESMIVEGAYVVAKGITTGSTTGYIESTLSSCTAEGVSLYNLVKYTNPIQQGDSGGPVCVRASGNVQGYYLMAMNNIGVTQNGVQYALGCRMSTVKSVFNLDFVTNGTSGTLI